MMQYVKDCKELFRLVKTTLNISVSAISFYYFVCFAHIETLTCLCLFCVFAFSVVFQKGGEMGDLSFISTLTGWVPKVDAVL